VGKTEAAKALASVLGRELVRLQCYEGIDAAAAMYEWNFPRQMLAIRQAGEGYVNLYADEYLIARPLLQALEAPRDRVLLIDEIDRADHEFEAFLLEFLSDFTISIPERGTVRAAEPPVVILTSNRTRELHEALRRRCVYHWIGYPDPALEAEIVMMRASTVARDTARGWWRAVNGLRAEPLAKPPGVAETVEWAEAATLLNAGRALAARLRPRDRRGAEGPGRSRLHGAAPRGAPRRGGGMTPAALAPSSPSRRRCARRACRRRPSRPRPSSPPWACSGPRTIGDIRRAAHAVFGPGPDRQAEFDAVFDAVFLGRSLDGPGRGRARGTAAGPRRRASS
jgi:hypothetical protein